MQHNTATTATFRQWFAERSTSERTTIMRLWSLTQDTISSEDILSDAFLRPNIVEALLVSLKPHTRAALTRIQEYGSAIPKAILEREFGAIRLHDQYPNPRAYLLALTQPASATEQLWIVGLIQLCHIGTTPMYVIPTDVQPLLPTVPLREQTLQLKPTSAPTTIHQGNPHTIEHYALIVFDAAHQRLLTYTSTGHLNKASLINLSKHWDKPLEMQDVTHEEHWPYVSLLRAMLEGTGLLRSNADGRVVPTRAALEWMQLPQLERIRQLLIGWVESAWDELTIFEKVHFQRAYHRDLAQTKDSILSLLAHITPHQWINLQDFITETKRVEPDFARPDGNYDRWGITDRLHRPLDGFTYWETVEGQQLRAIVIHTLHWLGLIDLGVEEGTVCSFRINHLGNALLHDAPWTETTPIELLVIQGNFEVMVPKYATLFVRFQIRRIAECIQQHEISTYKLTKKSIQQAVERGISVESIITFLREHSGREIPQHMLITLQEWGQQANRLSLRRTMLLEADDPLLLEQIKYDRRVRLPEIEVLTDTIWALHEGAGSTLAEQLRKAGYGLAGDSTTNIPLRPNDVTVLFAALEFYATACTMLETESDASNALRQRVAKLLSDKQLNRAYRMSNVAVQQLERQLSHEESRLSHKRDI